MLSRSLVPRLFDAEKRFRKSQTRNANRRAGLAGEKLGGTYSLGMRQRHGLAQAMLDDPDILILDEPMNGHDKHLFPNL